MTFITIVSYTTALAYAISIVILLKIRSVTCSNPTPRDNVGLVKVETSVVGIEKPITQTFKSEKALRRFVMMVYKYPMQVGIKNSRDSVYFFPHMIERITVYRDGETIKDLEAFVNRKKEK